MEIILKIIGLFVAFVLVVIAFKIALFLIGASLIPGLIVGGLSYWIFDAFWPGFMIGGGIGVVFGIIGQFSNNTSSSGSSDSGCSYPHPRDNSYPASREERSNRSSGNNSDKQSYIEELKRNYEDEKYYYEQYNEKAEKEFEQADVEKRYAEDYEWKYNEFNDESYTKVAIVVQSIIKTKGIDLRMRLTGIWTRHNNTRGAWKLKESIYRNPYSPAIITNNNTNINTIKINTEAFQYYLALKS